MKKKENAIPLSMYHSVLPYVITGNIKCTILLYWNSVFGIKVEFLL